MTVVRELFATTDPSYTGELRYEAESVQPKTFNTGSGTLAPLTPVSFDKVTGYWKKWGESSNEVVTITAHATTPATAGNWTITFEGDESGNIDHAATAATIQTALEAMTNIASGDVVVTQLAAGGLDTAGGGVQIEFIGTKAAKTVAVSATISLTGNDHVFTQVIAGSGINEVTKILAASTTATDGTFTITVGGETTGNLNHDDDAATILAALLAFVEIDVGDVIVTDHNGGLSGDDGYVLITFAENYAAQVVTVSAAFGSLVGNAHVLSEYQAGAATNGLDLIKGFLDEAITLDSSNEVLGNVIMAGQIHYDDILAAKPATKSTTELIAALKTGEVRKNGFNIQGLASFR